MNNSPLVSIGVPTYNSSRYLREVLLSLVGQSYYNTEIIISDDGSTDTTVDIAKEFSRLYPNVRVLTNDRNPGICANYRKCLKFSSGEYFAWSAADDLRGKDWIESLVSDFNENSVCICSRITPIDSESQILGKPFVLKNYERNSVLDYWLDKNESGKNFYIYGLWRRTILENANLIDSGIYFDQIWNTELIQYGNYQYSKKSNLYYRFHSEQNSKLKDDRIIRVLLFPFLPKFVQMIYVSLRSKNKVKFIFCLPFVYVVLLVRQWRHNVSVVKNEPRRALSRFLQLLR